MKKFRFLLLILLVLILLAVNNWLVYLMILLFVFLIMCSGLLIHEIGHLVAGLFLRYRFLFLIIGPLVLSKKNGSLTLTLNKSSVNLAQCGMIPSFNNQSGDRKKYIIYQAAGSIANFSTVSLGTILYNTSDNLLWVLLIISNLFIGILAIIPTRAEGIYYTDGLAIKILAKKDKTSEIYYELLKLTYSLTFNTKKNIKENEIEKLEYKCLNFIEEPLDNKILDQEIITYLLSQLVTLNMLNKRYTRCIHLIQPFITKRYLKGILREEVIISYLYAKLAVENKIEKSLFKLNFSKSAFHFIPKIKYEALLLFTEQQKKLAVKTLKSAKKELFEKKSNVYNTQQEITVIEEFIEIMENS